MNSYQERQPYTVTPQSAEYNFRDFSIQPEYRKVNRDLLAKALNLVHIPDEGPLYVVDVATGTGLVPQEIIKLLREKNIQAEIYGIDPDAHALEIARQETPTDSFYQVIFIKGKGQEISTILSRKKRPRWITIHDAIHEIPDNDSQKYDVKQAVLDAMAESLELGGILTMNSAFTTKSYIDKDKSAGMAWGRWITRAHELLGIKREKTSLAVLEPDTYKKMITASGLEIMHKDLVPVNLSKEALIAISHYPNFVNGAITGSQAKDISLEKRSQALVDALNEKGIESLPRTWFEVIARKT